jgi:hypothetical protein
MISEHRMLTFGAIAFEGDAPAIGRDEMGDRVPVAIVSLPLFTLARDDAIHEAAAPLVKLLAHQLQLGQLFTHGGSL